MQSLFSLEPIGGVDEIGSNMTMITTENHCILIDVGILFPYEDFFDINYLIPNFDSIPKDKNIVMLFTHGHEDHIGACVHFFKEFPDAVAYAPNFAKALIHKKLAEANQGHKINQISEETFLSFDNLEISFVHVNHSIPDTLGVLFRDKSSNYSGTFISDFKVDFKTEYEGPINLEKINKWNEKIKNKMAFIDSTNILFNAKTPSEKELIPDLTRLISTPDKRVFLTLFASNIHRMKTIYEATIAAGKKLIVQGRSIHSYVEIAKTTGHLPTDMKVYDIDQIEDLSHKKNVFVISGCQGDFRSTLRRFAFKEHNKLTPTNGDLFIFSSKTIPGNEKKIYRIINELTKAGVEVVTANDALIHASGHPGVEDLKIFIDKTMPTIYFPIHGESFFLQRHKEFVEKNYPKIKAEVIHNFHKIIFYPDHYDIKILDKTDPSIIHGKAIEIERERISERRKLATQGVIFLSFNKANESFIYTAKGLPKFIDGMEEKLIPLLQRMYRVELRKKDDNYISDELRIITRRFFDPYLGYKPQVVVHIC